MTERNNDDFKTYHEEGWFSNAVAVVGLVAVLATLGYVVWDVSN